MDSLHILHITVMSAQSLVMFLGVFVASFISLLSSIRPHVITLVCLSFLCACVPLRGHVGSQWSRACFFTLVSRLLLFVP